MENNRKYIAISAIFLGLVFLVLIIYIIFFKKDYTPPADIRSAAEEPARETPPAVPQRGEKEPEETAVPAVPIVRREFGQEDLKILAASFAERFGSFSNQSDYGNIRDLKMFMSARMIVWADGYIQNEILKHTASNIYYGITTKAVAEEVRKWSEDENTASIAVATQRREATGTMDNFARFSQDILINFIKEGGAWKVDGAYWQDR